MVVFALFPFIAEISMPYGTDIPTYSMNRSTDANGGAAAGVSFSAALDASHIACVHQSRARAFPVRVAYNGDLQRNIIFATTIS